MPIARFQMPDGRIARFEVPDGTTPEQAQSMIEKEISSTQPAEKIDNSFREKGIQAAQEKGSSSLGAFGRNIMQGIPFSDEAISGLAAIAKGANDPNITIPQAYEFYRGKDSQTQKQDFEEHPLASTFGVVTGGIGAAALASRIPGVGSALQKYAEQAPLRTAAATGAVSGGVYGLGAGEGSVQERLPGALATSALGAAIGPAAIPVSRAAGAALGRLGRSIVQDPATEAVKTVAEQPVTGDAAINKIIDKLREDYPNPQEFAQKLQEFLASPDKTLAEIGGQKTTILAKGAAQFPSGETETRKYLMGEEGDAGKLGGVSTRIKESLGKYLSSNKDYYGTADDILAKGREVAKPLYKEAFEKNKTMASPRLDRILSTPEGKDALNTVARYYQDQMKLVAKPDPELTALAKELGIASQGGVSGGLKLEALDAIKKELDLKVRAAKRAADMGSGSPEKFRAYEAVRSNLVEEIDNLDVTAKAGPNSLKPDGGLYAQARAKAGDYLRTTQALEDGRDFMKLDADMIKKQFTELSPVEQEAYKAGMVRSLRDKINNAQDKRNLYQVTFGNEEIRNKLSSVMNKTDFANLTRELKKEQKLYDFAYQVLGNSATTSKAIAAADIESAAVEIAGNVVTMGPKAAAVGAIGTAVKKVATGLNDKTAQQIAEALYETDPVKKLQIVKKIAGSNKTKSIEQKEAIKTFLQLESEVKKKTFDIEPGLATGAVVGQSTGLNKEN